MSVTFIKKPCQFCGRSKWVCWWDFCYCSKNLINKPTFVLVAGKLRVSVFVHTQLVHLLHSILVVGSIKYLGIVGRFLCLYLVSRKSKGHAVVRTVICMPVGNRRNKIHGQGRCRFRLAPFRPFRSLRGFLSREHSKDQSTSIWYFGMVMVVPFIPKDLHWIFYSRQARRNPFFGPLPWLFHTKSRNKRRIWWVLAESADLMNSVNQYPRALCECAYRRESEKVVSLRIWYNTLIRSSSERSSIASSRAMVILKLSIIHLLLYNPFYAWTEPQSTITNDE